MSVQVTFGGITYTIPEKDDSGWSDLTSYLVALSDAAIGTSDTKNIRVAASTPVSISSTDDYAVGVNVASASAVTLPSGSEGQIFVVFDSSGAAVNNNIVISGTGGQTINGLASYTIRSNYGAVLLQFLGSNWSVLSDKQIVTQNNQTNKSVVDESIATENDGVTVTNLQSMTFTFVKNYCEFYVQYGTSAMLCVCSNSSDIVDCLMDTSEKFLPSDSGTGVVVTKSGSIVTVKNRLGTSASFRVKIKAGQVSAATAWS
jgi:hypothetical protein